MPQFACSINEEPKDDGTWDTSNDPGDDGLDTNGYGAMLGGDAAEGGGVGGDGDDEGEEHADEADSNEDVEPAAVLTDATGAPGALLDVIIDTTTVSEAVVTKTDLTSSLTS